MPSVERSSVAGMPGGQSPSACSQRSTRSIVSSVKSRAPGGIQCGQNLLAHRLVVGPRSPKGKSRAVSHARTRSVRPRTVRVISSALAFAHPPQRGRGPPGRRKRCAQLAGEFLVMRASMRASVSVSTVVPHAGSGTIESTRRSVDQSGCRSKVSNRSQRDQRS